MTGLVTVLAARLVDAPPDPDDVKPGWIAGVVVLALIAATILLWLNMRKQIGKIRFDETDDTDESDDTATRIDGMGGVDGVDGVDGAGRPTTRPDEGPR